MLNFSTKIHFGLSKYFSPRVYGLKHQTGFKCNKDLVTAPLLFGVTTDVLWYQAVLFCYIGYYCVYHEFGYGGLVLGSRQFLQLPKCLKNTTCIKSVQKRLKKLATYP